MWFVHCHPFQPLALRIYMYNNLNWLSFGFSAEKDKTFWHRVKYCQCSHLFIRLPWGVGDHLTIKEMIHLTLGGEGYTINNTWHGFTSEKFKVYPCPWRNSKDPYVLAVFCGLIRVLWNTITGDLFVPDFGRRVGWVFFSQVVKHPNGFEWVGKVDCLCRVPMKWSWVINTFNRKSDQSYLWKTQSITTDTDKLYWYSSTSYMYVQFVGSPQRGQDKFTYKVKTTCI